MPRRPNHPEPSEVAALAFAQQPVPEAHSETIGVDTRERLIEAAGEVFAAKGFNAATVREICTRARANVAAINYHFGDKEALYAETLKYAARFAVEKYPFGAGAPPGGSPADRLAAFVKNYLDRLLDEGRPAWHGRLIAREMVDPTAALGSMVDAFLKPQHAGLREIVAALMGPGATEEQIRMGTFSVVAQCVFYKNCRAVIGLMVPETDYSPAGRLRLGAHITAMSIAGFAAVAKGSAAASTTGPAAHGANASKA